VEATLRAAEEPRILDLGCGVGRSSLALARAYPRASVRGVDLDPASIAEARAAAAAAGLADRVTFACVDAAQLRDDARYDLVTVFEALHDMGDPVGTLRAARSLLNDGGAVYVSDERVAHTFVPDETDVVERLQYAFSVLHCLPATMAEDPAIANGTVLRMPTLVEWARAAGFGGVQELDVDDPFWRHYRLDAGGRG
jgi:2-polyprenyl-3-methyl-5-hydroxy-6-metoxy-1,4-benzoquinol methylase